jgi:aminopeptidase N
MKDLDQQAKTIYLKDYQQPDYWIDHVDLTFELEEEKTRVISKKNTCYIKTANKKTR